MAGGNIVYIKNATEWKQALAAAGNKVVSLQVYPTPPSQVHLLTLA